jgi:RNA polymerase sigma-70 factor, ECF subfamily
VDATVATSDELRLVHRLRAGDEAAFMSLVEQLQPVMLRVARMYVASPAVAEEVVQEAWLGVLRGLDGFEGRSSLRTWVVRIVSNIAKTTGGREARSLPFASLTADDGGAPAFDPDRFLGPGQEWAGHWSTVPADWRDLPEERLASAETLERVREAIGALPPSQARVIWLLDVLGWTSLEVRNALELSETNQRVLLHRARAGVRRALEDDLAIEAQT